MEKRYIGIDLHRNRFTCCVRLENGRSYLSQWELEDLPRFVKKLRPDDELAVEVTGNARLFVDAVVSHVARIAVVDTNQVSGDQPIGEEDRLKRRPPAGAVSQQGFTAGGAHEG
jgi:hypothetical protein